MPRRTAKKIGIVDRFMNSWIVSGGLVMRRHEALRWLKTEGHEPRVVDYFAYHPEPLDLPLDAPTRTVAMPLECGGEIALELYDGPGGLTDTLGAAPATSN